MENLSKLSEISDAAPSAGDSKFKEAKSDAGDDKAFTRDDAGDDKAFVKNDAGGDKTFAKDDAEGDKAFAKNDAGDDKAFSKNDAGDADASKDEFGRTNKERMENGLYPIDKNGNIIRDVNGLEKPEKKGGSYGELKQQEGREGKEVHHMPAKSVSDLPHNDGPAIIMDKADHLRTASNGCSKEAQEYRQKQKELIEQGKFAEAIKMDIDDIHEKFGEKYDDAIAEMKEYVNKLEEEGRV